MKALGHRNRGGGFLATSAAVSVLGRLLIGFPTMIKHKYIYKSTDFFIEGGVRRAKSCHDFLLKDSLFTSSSKNRSFSFFFELTHSEPKPTEYNS